LVYPSLAELSRGYYRVGLFSGKKVQKQTDSGRQKPIYEPPLRHVRDGAISLDSREGPWQRPRLG